MKRGIVTGSSRGIGLATVQLLSKQMGMQVIGSSTYGSHYLNNESFTCLQLDLSRSESISAFVHQIGETKLDFLINNAGVLLENDTESKINLDQLKQTFSVNVFGTIELTEALLLKFNEGAHIINLSSEWGSFSDPDFDAFQPHYKMSKAALNMYTKMLSKRLENRGICVSALDPGWTKTDVGGPSATREANDLH